MARPVVLSDASPLIALSLIARLDLLASLFGRITITDVVRSEVLEGGAKPGQAAIAKAIQAKQIRVIADEWSEPKLVHLDEGEASILRAAIHLSAPCLVLIDERAGRAIARQLGIPHTGTVGLILQAKRRSLVPSARTIFEQLLEKDFRIAPDMIREALAQAGEV